LPDHLPVPPPPAPRSQAEPIPLIAKLGLPAHVTQNRDLPEGIDGAAIVGALEAAIAEMVPLLGLCPERDPLPGQVLRIVATAAKSLLSNPMRLREAVYLTEQARPDQKDGAALAHIRILGLAKLGEGPLLMAEIARLTALEPPNPALRDVLKGFDARKTLKAAFQQRAENHRLVWGDIPDDLAAHVRSMPERGLSARVPDRLIDFLFKLRPEEERDRAGFIDRLAWGMEAYYYMIFIVKCALKLRPISEEGGVLTDEESRVFALFQQIPDFVCTPDLTPLHEARASGRNIVVVEAHAGMAMLNNLDIVKIGMPVSVIAQLEVPAKEHDHFNIAASGDDVQTRFLKLMKLLKRQQRLVLVFPDGAAGEVVELDLFGRPVKVGRGGAMLAYHGRAVTFFVNSRWDGMRFRLSLVPGPEATGDTPREVFEAEFHQFYLDRLKDIVMSAPEDMGVGGGFWQFLS
jgi:hypothetical protein